MTNSALSVVRLYMSDFNRLNDTPATIPKALHSHATAVMNQVHNSITVKKPRVGTSKKALLLKPLAKVTSEILSSQIDNASPMQLDSSICERMPQKLDKNAVLEEYNAKYATSSTGPVVPMSKQGKRIKSYSISLPNHRQLVKDSTMKPSLGKQYRIKDLQLCDVAVSLVKFCIAWNEQDVLQIMSVLNTKYNMMVKEVVRLA
jgi:hypothetical protein